MSRFRRPKAIFAGLIISAMIAGGGIGVGEWRFGRELEAARSEIASRRFDLARGRLERLLDRRPMSAEVAFELGACRQALNDLPGAMEMWERIPSGSEHHSRAALYREQIELSQGRWADVESTLLDALRAEGLLARELRLRLARLWRFQGRLDEVAALLEANWDGAPDPEALLREHAGLDLEPLPAEMFQGVLEEAGRKAPEDDRVWLGRAIWDTRSGRLGEAVRQLASCLKRRPEGPAVWFARLEWAVASDRPDLVWEAIAHLPADRLTPPRIARIRAWLAVRENDPAAEREAFEAWLAAEPGSATPLERLAEIADQASDRGRADELRKLKESLDRDRRLYRSLLGGPRLSERAAGLAPLAERLGRRFEARGWWSVVLARSPGSPDALSGLERTRDADARPVGAVLAGPSPRELRPLPGRRADAGAPPHFDEDAGPSGLRFVYESGKSSIRQLPETMGGGVGLLDYDCDGWLDVYLVQGGEFPPTRGSPGDGDRLFRNCRDGTFEDVSESTGIASFPRGYGHGVAAADFDNDGRTDLLVTRWRALALYRNLGDGRFEDVTERAGLGGDRGWPTSAAFADLDGDGDLDLYVCQYLSWDAADPRICRDPITHAYIYCVPHVLDSLPDALYRNDDGRFVEVSGEAGVVDREGPGLGVVAADLDEDGRVDVFVANDGTADALYSNRGGLRFEEVAVASGAASNAEGSFQSGMGVAAGDLDGDGRLDLVVTNFYGEGTTFLKNFGMGRFADHSGAVGLSAVTRNFVGFGVAMLDFNNDGRLDLATVNGHVNDFRPTFPHAMAPQLLAGAHAGGTRLLDVSRVAGPPWTDPVIGRGLAVGDLDNDGRVDVLLLPHDGPFLFSRNRTHGGRFLTVLLEGVRSNRDGVGARVTVTVPGRRHVAWRMGGSYQSAGDPRLHFGLADAERVVEVEVHWPSGHVDRFRDLMVDRGYRLREGESKPLTLEGFGTADGP